MRWRFMADKKLGRGLDLLIRRTTSKEEPAATKLPSDRIPVASIKPNPFQPRREFSIEALNELIDSIRLHGVLQPISVRQTGENSFELIAGERRWRASMELGIETIPATILPANDEQMLEFAIIENVQREDLNPIEKAVAYRNLMGKFQLTQEEAAKRLGQKRSTLANFMRLLELPESIRERVANGSVSAGHARALLMITDAERQEQLAAKVSTGELTVRAVEMLAQLQPKTAPVDDPTRRAAKPVLKEIAESLKDVLGTKVKITGEGKRGRIVIAYQSPKDLERLIAWLKRDDQTPIDSPAEESAAETDTMQI